MKFLFKNESFSFEALRAIGFAPYGGADIGEVLITGEAIRDNDEASWLNAWKATARRIEDLARASLVSGNEVSAREAFLRASNYYRAAEFFRREDPKNDPEVNELSSRSVATFISASELFDSPVRRVKIPYEATTFPGYLFLVDDSGKPRPTIIYNNGFDSTAEESWFAIGAAALKRGYNVLAFDGPGQGAAIREQGLVFRHDWENVIKPVIDYALSRPEVKPDSIILFGYSLGAFLVARAAAFDHRPAALLLDDGIFDFHAAFRKALPSPILKWVAAGKDSKALPLLRLKKRFSTSVRWGLNNGVWTFGAKSEADFIRLTRLYTLEGIAENIQSPTLILDAENDQFLKGQPEILSGKLKCKNNLVTLTNAEGAGEHCHMGAMLRTHQVVFDWLAETLAAKTF